MRDVVIALQAQGSKCYHLGVGKHVYRSNLAKANEQRDCRIFEEFAYYMIEQAKQKFTNNIPIIVDIYAFDSTTIDLCLTLFDWAKFRRAKGGIKVHTLFDIATGIPTFVYITEAKVNDVNAMDEIPYQAGSFYIFDRGYNDFSRLYQEKDYPEKLRLVKYWDKEKQREFIFLTNNFDLTALEIAELYRQRWQIELFFKWMKSHLKIKRFYGTSFNAVKTQIYVAIITFCLVVIIKYDMKLYLTTYEILHILSISLTSKTHLRDLLDKTNFQNDKERLDSSEPLLFNLNF